MKCPKCHYLSFEPEARCRNCGYDLELADADLTLRDAEAEVVPVRDLRLRDLEEAPPALVAAPAAAARLVPERERETVAAAVADREARPIVRAPRQPRPARSRGPAFAVAEAPNLSPDPAEPFEIPVEETVPEPLVVPVSLDVVMPPPAPLMAVAPRPGRAPSTTSELPLFVKGLVSDPARDLDAPLVAAPAVARQPLSVRRRVPEPARLDAHAPEAAMERQPSIITYVSEERDATDEFPSELTDGAQAKAEARALVRAAQRDTYGDAVGPITRLAAAAIDGVLLAGIALGVLALTLRLCELTFAQATVLPLVPLGAFILLVCLGYLWLFTAASGQTLGKVALGIKVVAGAGTDRADRLTMAQAASRALWTAPSVLALGIGFALSFVGDGRTLHDRLSHTRVIRA